MSYSPDDALAVMHTTGDAYLDHEGCVVDSAEYVAALYESYAADHEYATADDNLRFYVDTYNIVPNHPMRDALEFRLSLFKGYARAAQTLAEDLWTRDVSELESAREREYDEYVYRYWS